MTIVTTSDQTPRTATDGQGAAPVRQSPAHTPTPAGQKAWNRLTAVARYYPVFLIFLVWEILSRWSGKFCHG
jgi:hypothetical protein